MCSRVALQAWEKAPLFERKGPRERKGEDKERQREILQRGQTLRKKKKVRRLQRYYYYYRRPASPQEEDSESYLTPVDSTRDYTPQERHRKRKRRLQVNEVPKSDVGVNAGGYP